MKIELSVHDTRAYMGNTRSGVVNVKPRPLYPQ